MSATLDFESYPCDHRIFPNFDANLQKNCFSCLIFDKMALVEDWYLSRAMKIVQDSSTVQVADVCRKVVG